MLMLFWGLLALLFYTFFGYPLLLKAWARLRPSPTRRAPLERRLAVIIVAHNEEARILRKIATCRAQAYPRELMHIVVVSDGSTDRTNALVSELGDPGVTLVARPTRRGKAACLVDGVRACSESLIVFTDARQQLHPDAVRRLLENFADESVGVVSGELVFRAEGQSGFGQGVDAYWAYEKFIRKQEAAVASVVGATGALYAIRREVFTEIPPETILDDVLIPMNAVLQGRRVLFEGGAVAYDQPSTEVAQERVRKIRTLAGNFQLLALRPALLNPMRNPIFLQFISHKVLRLAAPLAMALLLLANAVLAADSGFFAACLVAHALFYALALLGAWLPAARQWRIARLPATFLLLNWFVVLGLREYLSNKEAHLWKSKAA